MCPAPLYSYFDAQQLADFIMNSEFPGYDGANTTPATSDSTFNHMHNIAASFSGAPDDYESHDNARARKRRMTSSDERRASGSFSGFTLPDASNGLFCMLDHQQAYSSSAAESMFQAAALSSLPVPPDSGNSSLGTRFSANPSTDSSTGSVDFAQHAGPSSFFGGGNSTSLDGMSSQNMLGSPVGSNRAAADGRKRQSLSISVGHNEFGGSTHEPPTPGMFSPSFMDAMEGAATAAAVVAAAASMSSPPMLYNVTSPYTHGHPHHHSFSMPVSGMQQQHQQRHSAAGFLNGAANAAISPGSTDMSSALNATMLRSNTVGSSASGGFGGAEDFTAGLHINMNAAAAAAAMASSFDDGTSNAGAGSAFSRVQDAGDMSQLLCTSGAMSGQVIAGMDLTMGSGFAPFTNIQGLEHFSPNPWDRQNIFLNTSAALNSSDIGTSYGMMTTEPSLLRNMDGSVVLQDGAPNNPQFALACGSAAVMGATSAVGYDASITSPLVGAKTNKPRSPTAMQKRSRKRAATVANIHSHDNQHSISSAILDLTSASHASKDTPSLHSRSSSATAAYTGPVFNSQAVVKGTGSKVMMVLTSKVAQKSYGTEKRFLCPPPTILMFGTSWQLPTLNSSDGSVQATNNSSGDMLSAMPRISVSVSSSDTSGPDGDSDDMGAANTSTRRPSVPGLSAGSRTCQLEWLPEPEPTPKPKAHVPHNPTHPVRPPQDGELVTGRYVAKQLFINDVDEKRKKVSVKVRVHDPSGQLMLNEFDSRPIKVISKPSKKRQSVKNVDLCIHHGSTVSLFNRLRSQTVSTKYLGVTRSMSVGGPRPFWFPALSDESKAAMQPGSNGRPLGPASNTTFVARNSVWDPFIVWIVDTHLGQKEIDAFNARIAENPTPIPGYPTPPTFALHPQCPPDFDTGNGNSDDQGLGGSCGSSINGDTAGQPQPRAPIPILYNQPVILQCVSTGMCSPVLTLRKVEKGSLAVGCFYGRDHSRDVLGDPVSQLHKVAFEVRVQTLEELPAVTVTPAGLNTRVGSYLTCMGDIVGLNSTCDGRQLTSDPSSGSKPIGTRALAPGQGRKQAKDSVSVGTTSWAEDVGDNAVWTVVGTDCAIYRFDYPDESEIVDCLQNPVSVHNDSISNSALSSSLDAALPHAQLNLPPTPTSPRGVQEYSQHVHQQDSGFSFDMMLASQATAVSTSAANADFHGSGSLGASFAAAMFGMDDALAPHLLSTSSQTMHPTTAIDTASLFDGSGVASIIGTHPGHASADQMNSPVVGDSLIPIVFKSSVQHPPAINPLCRDSSSNGNGGAQSVAERAVITMQGLNFTPDMVISFDGKVSLYTEFKSSESIACLGPLSLEFADVLAQKSVAEDGHGNGNKQQQHHPSSPSISDSSLQNSSSDDTDPFVEMSQHNSPRTHRASSAESTASSSTATFNNSNSASLEKAGKSGGGSNSLVLSKGTKKMLKIPIYLSRNGGAGPTFKTGQFYTMHF